MVNINDSDNIIDETTKPLVKNHNGHQHDDMSLEHPGHEELHNLLITFSLFFVIIMQFVIFIWKSKYPRSFLRVSLFGLLFFPILVSLYYSYIRMIVIWSLFCGVLLYLYKLSTANPLDRKTPKIVFMWFYFIYIISFLVTAVGFLMVMFSKNPNPPITVMFYGLYFGLLGRDFAELCSDRIASILGLGGSRLPFTSISNNYCAICTNNLKFSSTSTSTGSNLLISNMNDQNPTNSSNNSSNNQKISSDKIETKLDNLMNLIFSKKPVELPGCKHVFHEWCIRGWSLVGKKNICPHCNEKVNLRELSDNPWEKNTFIWGTLLDSVRYLVVWNPLILYFVQFIIYLFDRDKFIIKSE